MVSTIPGAGLKHTSTPAKVNQEAPPELLPQEKSLAGQSALAPVAVALIIAGSVLLLGFIIDLGSALVPILSLVFIVFGIAGRQDALLFPGGILGGIGLGIAMVEGPFASSGDANKAGIFLLSFAAGWFTISMLSALVTRKALLWAFIPGSIMAIVGTLLITLGTSPAVWRYLGMLLPLVLIVFGVCLLLMRSRPVEQ